MIQPKYKRQFIHSCKCKLLQVINLDLLQLFVQRSPEELRRAVQSGDADGTIANLLATLKVGCRTLTHSPTHSLTHTLTHSLTQYNVLLQSTLTSISPACIFDLYLFMEALLKLASKQRVMNQCYIKDTSDELCDCLDGVSQSADFANATKWPLQGTVND